MERNSGIAVTEVHTYVQQDNVQGNQLESDLLVCFNARAVKTFTAEGQ